MKITQAFAPITIVLETEHDKHEFVNLLQSLVINYERSRAMWMTRDKSNYPDYVKLAEDMIRKIK